VEKSSHTGLIVTVTVVALVLVAALVTTVAVLANRRRNT